MLLVGLTGGIATGKSTVARLFAGHGAAIVDADRIAHDLQRPGQPCHRAIVDAFGMGILDQAGRIDRRALGALVFADPSARRTLEAIMHPAIRETCQAEVRAAETAGRAVCMVDAALILEAGQQQRYQKIVLVSAPEEVQIQRLMQGRGFTDAEARQRVRAQWPTASKAAYADFIIDNAGELAASEAQVGKIYAALRDCACRKDTGPASRAADGMG